MSTALGFGASLGGVEDEPIHEPGLQECMPVVDDEDGLDEDVPVDEEPGEDGWIEPEFRSASEDEPIEDQPSEDEFDELLD